MVELVRKSIVISNEKVCKNIFLMELECDKYFDVAPGQFIIMYPENNADFTLPRPFSIFELKDKRMFILYKVVGNFTSSMTCWKSGKEVKFGGPFGNGFELYNEKKVIFVAGGVGIAALNVLGKMLQDVEPILYYGAKSKEELLPLSVLSFKPAELIISTEDGSEGRRGMITDFIEDVQGVDIVYTAGPVRMLEKVVKSVEAKKVFVSVEGRMACGVGICMGCGVFTKEGTVKRICCEGPIFDGGELNWESLS